MAANERLAKLFVLGGIEHLQSLVGDFVGVVADVQFNDVPFLGDLVAVLVGRFPVAVEQAPGHQAFVVKTSRASLDVIIFNVQIGRPAQSRDHLIQNGASLLLVGLGAGLRFWAGGFLGRQAGYTQTKKRKHSHWISIFL